MSKPERPARGRSRPFVVCVIDVADPSVAATDFSSMLTSLEERVKRGRRLALRSPLAELERALDASALHRNHDVAHVFGVGTSRAGWKTDLLDPDIPPVPRCRLHLFAALGDATDGVSARSLLALLDVASFEQLPVVVHALVGASGQPRGAADALARLEDLLGDRGVVGTLSGIDSLDLAPVDDPWSRLISYHRAVVLGDAPTAPDWYEALSSAYDAELDDRSIAPTRLGSYAGVQGDFSMEFGSGKRDWEWVGEDVGLILDLGEERVARLGAILSGASASVGRLPESVLAELELRGRAVAAFDEDSLRALVGHAAAHPISAAYSVARPLDIVARLLERAGGAHKSIHSGSAAETVGAIADLAAALERAEHDLFVAHLADPHRHDEHRHETRRGLLQVAEAVAKRGGALVVTTSARGETHRTPLLLVDDHHDYGELHAEASIEDLAATLLDLLDLPPHDAWAGRDLRKPR